jgi:2-dehydropantoate 2-reductase
LCGRRAPLRSTRADLVIESPMGDLRLPANAITTEDLADAVLLSAKTYDLKPAIDAIRPAVGVQTAVLPVLNGPRHLDRLDAAFGRERILGGVACIGATLTSDGTVRHLNRVHGITFGKRGGKISDQIETIARLFAATPFAASVSDNIMRTAVAA